MLRIHSFLQSINSYIKAVSKHLYRTCAILMTGTAVIAVIAFSSHEFGGSGKNRIVPLALEAGSECKNSEETEADTEAKVQTLPIEESKNQLAKAREALVAYYPVAEMVMMAGGREEEDLQEAYPVTEYEYDILVHIVAAEAGGCDSIGQILVANVILNRVNRKEFPNDIESVVFQKNQFSPVSAGTLWSTEVTDEVRESVNRALAGEDYSQGALFFSARARLGDESMAWFDENLKWLFEHDGHEFYTFQ